MTTREQAMQWWNNLKLTEKVVVMNRSGIEYYRSSDSLTGSEIEKIWRKETKTENIYLNRLKEQYKLAVENEESEFYISRLENYQSVRAFCLDTQLVSFNDIETMEYEVNQSF